MKLLVIGATSGIGLLTVKEALARGHEVRAMGRSAAAMGIDDPKLERFPGDALDAGDVARALDGVDAVIQALGITESVKMLWEEVTLFSGATRILIPAMKEAGIARLLVVTGFGAGRSSKAMSAIERLGHRAILGKPYADKDRQEAMVMDSGLDWTIVRPVILTNNRGTGRYRVLKDPETWRNGLIPRADVAHYLVRAAEAGTDTGSDVVLAR